MFICLPLLLFFCAKSAGEFLIIEQPIEKPSAIFVLSGSAAWGERTNKAAELYRAGATDKIVLTNDGEKSGWQEGLQRNPYYWEWETWNLIAKGVPPEKIEVLPPIVKGTHEEVLLLREIARRENWQSVLIVTSPFHTRRALFAVNQIKDNQNLQTGVVPAHDTNYWWTNWREWRTVALEYVKFVYYWVFY